MSDWSKRVLIVWHGRGSFGCTEYRSSKPAATLRDELSPVALLCSYSKEDEGPPSSIPIPEDFEPRFYAYGTQEELPGTLPIDRVPVPRVVIVIIPGEGHSLPLQVLVDHPEVRKRFQQFIAETGGEDDREEFRYDVFISHAAADTRRAEQIEKALSEAGIVSYLASKKLKPGDPWAEAVRDALLGSREVCVLYTPNSAKSEWVLTEWGAAWVLGKTLVPVYHQVRLEDLPDRLRASQAVDFADLKDYASAVRERLGSRA